jgi:hypothetical protein
VLTAIPVVLGLTGFFRPEERTRIRALARRLAPASSA